eukprot:4889461-Amphidinium_carterae.1
MPLESESSERHSSVKVSAHRLRSNGIFPIALWIYAVGGRRANYHARSVRTPEPLKSKVSGVASSSARCMYRAKPINAN